MADNQKKLDEVKASFGVNAEVPEPTDVSPAKNKRPADKTQGDPAPKASMPPEMAPTDASPAKNKRPADKATMVKEMVAVLASMDKDDLGELYDAMCEGTEGEAKVADIVSEDLNSLFGDELSEEFKTRAFTLFEAAVLTKIEEQRAALEEAYEARIEEEAAAIVESMTDRLDAYLDHVVAEWMTENKLAVESGIRNEIAESFLVGLKNLFAENYVEIPEEQTDVVEELMAQVEELKSALSESLHEIHELRGVIEESSVGEAFDEVVEGLTESQKDRLAVLAEGIDYSNVDEFRAKLNTIKESYFSAKRTVEHTEQTLNEEVVVEDTNTNRGSADPMINEVVAALSRTIKK